MKHVYKGQVGNIKDNIKMDTKDTHNSASFNDPLNWKSLGFFSAEDYLLYIFKKTEKITSALYLISGLLKDEEPMKWELRDKGMDLVGSSFMASSSVPGDKNFMIQSLFSSALETISLLNIAKLSNLISPMNHKLLVAEIDNVLGLLRDKLASSAENAGYVLSEEFFMTPSMLSAGFKSEQSTSKTSGISDKKSPHIQGQERTEAHKGHVDVIEKKSTRQEAILTVLKGQSNLTIKDFVKVIKDCSEKTIQRDLIELVDRGMVKKEGERRWSRYSLK